MLQRLFPVFGFLLLLLGCQSPAGFDPGRQPPTVTLVDIVPGQFALLEQSLVSTVRFVNPNPEDIAVTGLRMNLYLDGSQLGTGVSSERFTLPRLGEATTTVTLRVQTADLIDRVMQIGRADSVDYQIAGDLFTGSTLASNIPFDATSSIRLPQLIGPMN